MSDNHISLLLILLSVAVWYILRSPTRKLGASGLRGWSWLTHWPTPHHFMSCFGRASRVRCQGRQLSLCTCRLQLSHKGFYLWEPLLTGSIYYPCCWALHVGVKSFHLSQSIAPETWSIYSPPTHLNLTLVKSLWGSLTYFSVSWTLLTCCQSIFKDELI